MTAAPTDDHLFRAVFEGTLDALCLADDDGVYTDVNAAAAELFGAPQAELVGRSIDEFATEDFDFDAAWATFLEEGEMRGQFELQRPDGETRVVEFAANADILPGVHLSALRDVTDREADREALNRKTELLSRIFETSPVGIALVDRNGTIVDANDRAESILGLERSALAVRTYDDPEWRIVDENDEDLAVEELPVARVVESGEPIFGFEHGITHTDGDRTWLSVNAAPLFDDEGNVEQVITTIEDVTERREYRRLLEQQNERLEEYSATVSHDLRSPLSVASGWVDIAIEEESTDDLEKAKAALQRMESLISDLRALGRYGQTVDGAVDLELAAVAEEAWRNVDTADADLELGDDLGSASGEEPHLLQLFENLFRNAVEHGSTSPPSGTQEDAVEHAGPEVAVRVGSLDRGFFVADDGPGIPPEEREAVFEYGYSTRENGSGLGLAIVEAVADAHGWELTLTDADPHGARFEFRPRWHPDRED
jgi:PAS domain S-box-containing protein